jgi:hypothetical protein
MQLHLFNYLDNANACGTNPGHQALNVIEHKKAPRASSPQHNWEEAPGRQAINIIEHKLQGIKPSMCWAKTPGQQALNLNEYAWTQHLTTWNILNITYDSNNLDNILQLYNLDRQIWLYDINGQQQQNNNIFAW